MYFNRKIQNKRIGEWLKKGNISLFGCSLVLTVGAVMASSSVKLMKLQKLRRYLLYRTKKMLRARLEPTPQLILHLQETVSSTSTESTSTSATTVESSSTTQKEADSVAAPSFTTVADASALTAEEISNVTEAIKGSNPTAVSVQVSNDGSAVVTFCRWVKRNISSFSNS